MGRLRYGELHWSREKDVEKGLNQYLELNENVFNKTMNRFFKKNLEDINGKKILDYGGGAGYLSVYCAGKGAEVVLVDAEEASINTAKYYAQKSNVYGNIKFIQSEVVPVSLKDRSYDIILVKDVIEHIQEDQKFLHDISECQKNGGVVHISTQNKLSLNYLFEGNYQKYIQKNIKWCGWDQTHVRFYTPDSIKKILLNAGYIPIKWSSVYIVPYDIFSWFFLRKIYVSVSLLRYIDYLLGSIFPFNRFGWNFIVSAMKIK